METGGDFFKQNTAHPYEEFQKVSDYDKASTNIKKRLFSTSTTEITDPEATNEINKEFNRQYGKELTEV